MRYIFLILVFLAGCGTAPKPRADTNTMFSASQGRWLQYTLPLFIKQSLHELGMRTYIIERKKCDIDKAACKVSLRALKYDKKHLEVLVLMLRYTFYGDIRCKVIGRRVLKEFVWEKKKWRRVT